MNLDIANCKQWNKKTIADRAQRLADLAVKIWPFPPKTPATDSVGADFVTSV